MLSVAANLGGGPSGPYIYSIDSTGSLFHLTTDLVDIYHPNALGHAKDAVGVVQAFQVQVVA